MAEHGWRRMSDDILFDDGGVYESWHYRQEELIARVATLERKTGKLMRFMRAYKRSEKDKGRTRRSWRQYTAIAAAVVSVIAFFIGIIHFHA
jgi:hypothetical protein